MGPQSEDRITTGKVGKNAMQASPKSTFENFTGLASDSREVKPGYLFAALPGTKVNGAEFVKDAVARGAVQHPRRDQLRDFHIRRVVWTGPRRPSAPG